MKNKVIIFSDNQNAISELVTKHGFEIVTANPDFIVSFGGDGTVMRSEYQYPQIPKIILKNSRICKLCSKLDNSEVLEKIISGKYSIEENLKITGLSGDRKLTAMNDIVVHNADPRHAIRYRFSVDGTPIGHEIIGDGIVSSTPLGSTGYYRSITDSFFETGIGLAFNNSTEQSDHMVLRETSEIEVEITRGPAIVYADNQVEQIHLTVGDKITIKKSEEVTKIVRV